jgi:hypothetical protein
MEKHERLKEIFGRLEMAPAATNADEAVEQLTTIMDAVEDQFSGVPFNPESWQHDGRLYAPQGDSARSVPGSAHVTRYRTRRHNVFVAVNGALEVQTVASKDVVFSKPGADGRGVWDQG